MVPRRQGAPLCFTSLNPTQTPGWAPPRPSTRPRGLFGLGPTSAATPRPSRPQVQVHTSGVPSCPPASLPTKRTNNPDEPGQMLCSGQMFLNSFKNLSHPYPELIKTNKQTKTKQQTKTKGTAVWSQMLLMPSPSPSESERTDNFWLGSCGSAFRTPHRFPSPLTQRFTVGDPNTGSHTVLASPVP